MVNHEDEQAAFDAENEGFGAVWSAAQEVGVSAGDLAKKVVHLGEAAYEATVEALGGEKKD